MFFNRTRRASRAFSLLGAAVAAATLGAAASLPCVVPAASAQENPPAPASAKIAFERHGGVWVMDADGTNQTQLTAYGFDPAFSPDGTKIAYRCGDGDLNNYICTMNADGSDAESLTDIRGDFDPAWSPDGQRIAFTRYGSHGSKIYVMNADGTAQAPMFPDTPENEHQQTPAFSPDGTRVAYSSDDQSERAIYVRPADGSAPARRVSFSGNDYSPNFSPDGTHIVFDSVTAIRRVQSNPPVDAGGQTVDTTETLYSAGDYNSEPAHSPDGTKIAFFHETVQFVEDEHGNTEIIRTNGVYVRQGGAVSSLNAPGGSDPSFQPAVAANRAPVAQAKNAQLAADAGGTAVVTAADIDDGSYDPDAGDQLTLSIDVQGPLPVGQHNVTLTAADNRGASATAAAVVTVVDQTAPVVTSGPGPREIGAACGAQATMPDLTGLVVAADNVTPSAALSKTQQPAAGAALAAGQTPVVITVADAAGNASTFQTSVTVAGASDTTAPAVTAALAAQVVTRTNGQFRVEFGAADTCDSAPSMLAVMSAPSAAGFEVVFQQDSAAASEIKFDLGKRRVTLRGRSEAEMRALLAALAADGGARVSNGQTLLLQQGNAGNGQELDKYTYTFAGGALVQAKSPSLLLRVRATDAAGNTAEATAQPVFRQ